jgi:hypothetical protein
MVNAFTSRNKSIYLSQLLATLSLVLLFTVCANSQAIDPAAHTTKSKQPSSTTAPKSPSTSKPTTKDSRYPQHAHGTFDVKITPLPLNDKSAPTTLGRRAVERQIHGDFEGTSRGEMLTAKTTTEGSEAYCAMEYITGTLKGRKGTFILQHKGLMRRGKLDIVLSVVPDSGTGDLTGLNGILKIDVASGKHLYDLAYKLPDLKK